MRLVADDVYMLNGFPRDAINVYLVGDVLVDAGTTLAARRILRQIETKEVNAHALTHAHPDHFGSSYRICTERGIPLWAPADDAEAVEKGEVVAASKFAGVLPSPPGHPVARRLQEGDEVAGFTVLDTPGHSAGHVSYWRESDRVLIAGDVVNTMTIRTGWPALHEPEKIFTPDPARNRESIRRIAALEPRMVLVGHGAPWRDPAKLSAFAATLS